MTALGLTSTEFIVLLPIVVLIYYISPLKCKKYVLLLINVLFYASFGYKYVAVVFGMCMIIWIAAQRIGSKLWRYLLYISLLAAVLLFFRLAPFSGYSIVAPLGISFYTLQAISYVADVRRGKIEAEKNFIKLLTYLTFFPTITSGPIYRYVDFEKEHNRNIKYLKTDYKRITDGIVYMLWGYFLKLVVAERAAIPVNQIFDERGIDGYSGMLLFIVAITYSIQIYADFAGYSAIVIGIAQIFGYKIPENFNAPYLSADIKEFWSRWHISLSTWLRDYIYIPLGGNRKGKFRKYCNLMITFLVSGLWHGFRGHFVIWGGYHAVWQILSDATQKTREKLLPYIGIRQDSFFYKLLKRLITFMMVTIAWIFFRTGVKSAVKYIIAMVTSTGLEGMVRGDLWELGLPVFGWILLGISVLVVLFVELQQCRKSVRVDEMVNGQGALGKWLILVCLMLVILIFGIYGDQHDASYFVYRDF